MLRENILRISGGFIAANLNDVYKKHTLVCIPAKGDFSLCIYDIAKRNSDNFEQYLSRPIWKELWYLSYRRHPVKTQASLQYVLRVGLALQRCFCEERIERSRTQYYEFAISSELQEKCHLSRGTVKLTKSIMHAAKTTISLRSRAVWSVCSLSAGRKFGPMATNNKWNSMRAGTEQNRQKQLGMQRCLRSAFTFAQLNKYHRCCMTNIWVIGYPKASSELLIRERMRTLIWVFGGRLICESCYSPMVASVATNNWCIMLFVIVKPH